MTLATLLEEQFFLLKTTVRADKTREHYRRAVRWLGEMLGRPATIADLTDDHLAALLNWLRQAREQTEVTANTSYKCLAALWRWCRDRGLVHSGPTVSKLPAPRRSPTAWSSEELMRLVAAARAQTGSICGRPAAVWWMTLLALELDTGARAGELLRLRWEWISWERGWITVPAEVRKSRQADACYALGDDTLRWLESFRQPTGLILGWNMCISRYYQLWDGLLDSAGLPRGRRNKTHRLRRSYATLLQLSGRDASRALGHSSAAVTREHYLDPTQCDRRDDRLIPLRVLAGQSR